MISGKAYGQRANRKNRLLAVGLVLSLWAGSGWAQVTASITGTLRDSSGAVVPSATVTVKHLESGLTRTAETDLNGGYTVPSLPVGPYEMTTEKAGFKQQVRRGINLVVGQQAVVNLTLEVGNVQQVVEVTAEAPIVNTTLSSTSGLVGEKQVKDLPLNGRSFDQLLTLNVGTANYTSSPTATVRNFSVAGRRTEENRFLMNGVEYVGADTTGNTIVPFGSSGNLLGVDAVREFNVVQHTYGAEYGKRAGGQVTVVTTSGTNQLHGSLFEYLRNSALDARNFFDVQNAPKPTPVPPFKRNQFGGALGGPIIKDKIFLFGNYEGFRERLGLSNVATVPDALARQGLLPIGPNNSVIEAPDLTRGMLRFMAFWPDANGSNLGGGVALHFSNPPQEIRTDFGLTRFDYNVSAKDSFSVNYNIDDGDKITPSRSPVFTGLARQRSQVLGLQETHIFSPSVLNVATAGFSRANSRSGTVPTVPLPANVFLVPGTQSPGTINVGAALSDVGASITPTGGGDPTATVRNFFTWSDDVSWIKGKHSWRAGLWMQRIQTNNSGPGIGASQWPGEVRYTTLLTFLQDRPSLLQTISNLTPLGWRTTEAAWYIQDEIKLRPNLSLRVGLRDEMTSGWNEAHCRAAQYVYDPNGVIQENTVIGCGVLLKNNARVLWQPRVGLAWDPTGTGTWAVRAGFGIHNDLQDNLLGRTQGNQPFNGRVGLSGPLLSNIPLPLPLNAPPQCTAPVNLPCTTYRPMPMEPNMHTPTVQRWSLTVERGITRDLMLQLGYVGSQGYHFQLSVNTNAPKPQVCADPQGCVSGGVGSARGLAPQGMEYVPWGNGRPNTRPNPFVADTSSFFYQGNNSYHALNVSLVQRASHGLTFKTNYTFAKTIDMHSAVSTGAASNQPQTVLNVYNLSLNKGLAAYNLKHQFNTNFSYQLPFGKGQRFGGGASGVVNYLIGDWQWQGILTARNGFPFTPVAGSNISGTGDTANPDVPNRNPAYSGPVILGRPERWYDPNAFVLPIVGTFGNVSRGSFTGPGQTTFDTSLFKSFRLHERWNLQFRAEAFNLLNHANFGSPQPGVFSGRNFNPAAGLITSTTTTSRQLQFALKLTF